MVMREWLVETEKSHTVRVDHWTNWVGRVHIYLDDKQIYEKRLGLFDYSTLEHRFKVDGLPYIIRILYRTWHYEYELWVDGKLQ